MFKFVKHAIVFSLVATLVVAPFATTALADDLMKEEEISAPAMMADAVVIRPVGILATGVGFVVYIVSLPFSYPGGNTQKVWENLVEAPAKYTFKRPLGDL